MQQGVYSGCRSNVRVKKNLVFMIKVLTTLLLVIVVLYPISTQARGRVLENIGFRQIDQALEVKIDFTVPLRYLHHNPQNYGREVQIQISPLAPGPIGAIDLKNRETLSIPDDNPAGISRVEYEGRDVVGPTVTVNFSRARSFEIKQGSDSRSLIITIRQAEDEIQTTGQAEKGNVYEKKPVSAPVAGSDQGQSPGVGMMPLTQARQDELMEQGVTAMAEGDYMRAIQVYTRLLDTTDTALKELAQFELARAQDKKGFKAHARAEYQAYLQMYPDGTYADQAQKRLQEILSVTQTGTGQLQAAESEGWEYQMFGSLGQYYERDEGYPEYEDNFDGPSSIVNYSTLRSEYDATMRIGNERFLSETVVIGSYESELEKDQDNRLRTNAAYLDLEVESTGLSTRLGRQTINTGGILGRFDGGVLGYRLTDKMALNVASGFPVDLSYDGVDTDRHFYGINLDIGRIAEYWDVNLYFVDRTVDSIDDRRAIGTEARWTGSRASFFSLIDYDILYSEPAIFLFSGNWLLPDDLTRVYASADFRTSPILGTDNALIGQSESSLSALVDALGSDTVEQLAQDRTLDSRYVTVGVSHTLTEDVQISGDVSWSDLGGGPASGGVDEIQPLGDAYYYSVQVNGSNLFIQGDLATLGLRFDDTKQRDTYSLILNSSHPYSFVGDWRARPKLRVDYRSNNALPGDQWQFRPGLILEVMLAKRWHIEMEGEYRWANRELEGLAEDKEGYYLAFGFRWDF